MVKRKRGLSKLKPRGMRDRRRTLSTKQADSPVPPEMRWLLTPFRDFRFVHVCPFCRWINMRTMVQRAAHCVANPRVQFTAPSANGNSAVGIRWYPKADFFFFFFYSVCDQWPHRKQKIRHKKGKQGLICSRSSFKSVITSVYMDNKELKCHRLHCSYYTEYTHFFKVLVLLKIVWHFSYFFLFGRFNLGFLLCPNISIYLIFCLWCFAFLL